MARLQLGPTTVPVQAAEPCRFWCKHAGAVVLMIWQKMQDDRVRTRGLAASSTEDYGRLELTPFGEALCESLGMLTPSNETVTQVPFSTNVSDQLSREPAGADFDVPSITFKCTMCKTKLLEGINYKGPWPADPGALCKKC